MQMIRPMLNKFHIKLCAAGVALLLLSACWTSDTLAPAVRYNQREGAGTTGIHTIGSGDTVYNIAERYKLVMRDIILVNDLQAPYRLEVGQRLRLPPPRTYKVRGRDSLYTVSRLFNVSATQLARLNDLRAPFALRAGQVLKLPVVDDRPAATMQTAAVITGGGVVSGADAPVSTPVPVTPGAIEREELSAPQVTGQSIPAPPAQVANVSLSSKIPATTPPRAGSKFIWPVQGQVISRYGPKAGGLHNDGINIRAPKGAPVRAAENGVVVYADTMKGYGNMVLIRHADRWMTAYAHLDNIQVKRGATLKRGETVGVVGSTGSVDEPQLHFEVRRGVDALNPEKYM